jgi:hypothetical protein
MIAIEIQNPYFILVEVILKESKKQIRQREWGHKILRVVRDESFMNTMLPARPRTGINHIILDDLEYEHDSLNIDGWRYQMGFALDDDDLYLFYKKPVTKDK